MTLKELRLSTGLTQQKFAERLGISRVTVARWDAGEQYPPEYIIGLLERNIDCAIDKESTIDSIKEIRESLGLSQSKVYDLIGVPVRTIQEWEGGKRKAAPYIKRIIANELLKIAEENKESA